jgi:hypothetical protein
MEKIQIKFPGKTTEEFYVDGQKIIVKKYISLEDKYTVISNLMTTISSGIFWTDYIQAKYEMILAIVDMCTNISISIEQENLVENIISSGLWDNIKSRIVNYNEFEKEIFDIQEFIIKYKAIEISENSAINKVAEKILELLNKFSELDFSKEGMRSLLDEFKKETSKLSEIYPTIKEEKPVRKKRASKSITE